ncbi:MAG: D-glycero-beta-D-manno-heptose 1-phosphate adenylyltransferase [Sphingobacteriales bacterium]|nr:MAG: D-glycero-beta-D-manno-heptose 1-phosphate adenylyltransferase [Sphingobacteriales bacterium]
MSPLQKIQSKQFDRDSLLEKVETWDAKGLKIVFTNGCFDILHPGHIDYLAKAKSLGDKLIIGVNTDASVQKLKGKNRPIQNEKARLFLLGALEFVDAVILFGEDTPAQLISQIMPHILVKGADYTIDKVVGAETVIPSGGSVVLLPYLQGFSTSGIEKKILFSSVG